MSAIFDFLRDPGIPAIIFPILLLVGGDIIHKALAIVGGRHADPINCPFSIGWVIYSLSALLPVFGGNCNVLPNPEVESFVLNLNSGQYRKNESFILSRLLRDLEIEADDDTLGGLRITEYDSVDLQKPDPEPSNLELSAFVLHFLQLLIAVLASYNGCHQVLYVFLWADFLAGVSLCPEVWKSAKFSARRQQGQTYALLRGTGHRHIFIIKNRTKSAFALEDLAAGPPTSYDWFASETPDGAWRIGTAGGWLALFVYTSTLSSGVGYLLLIMLIGTIANLLMAAMPRTPARHGFPLVKKASHAGDSVMGVLGELDAAHKGWGMKLCSVLFPAGLGKDDPLIEEDVKNEADL